MKYVIHLNAYPTEAVSIAQKHAQLVAGLGSVPGDWGLASTDHPAPDPGCELSAQFHLGKALRGRGVRGFASYRFRGGLQDEAEGDDIIDLDFNPARVDFSALIKTLPLYLAAFEPYFGYVADEEFGFLDFDRSRNMNYRITVLRIYPICFLSSALCAKALGLSVAEVAHRLAPRSESVMEISGGILVVGHTEPLPFESAKSISDELSGLVGVKVV